MRFVLCLFLAATSLLSAAQAAKESDATPNIVVRTAGLKKQDGFLPYYWDAKKGELLFELSASVRQQEFLYFVALGSGTGSTKIFADRSSTAGERVCRFRQVGSRVLVIEENPAFRAENGSPALKNAVEYSFPTSVLAALPVEAEQDGTLLVNANSLLIRDAAGLLSQLHHPTQAVNGVMVRQESSESNWHLDDSRSVID